MTYGLSFEVNVPEHVEESAVIKIGERFDSSVVEEEMTVAEALQLAFTDVSGIADLARLGVTWESIATGRN